jgi:hypothetical protein
VKGKSSMREVLLGLGVVSIIGVVMAYVIVTLNKNAILEIEDQRITDEACARLCHPHVFKACSKVESEGVEVICATDVEGMWSTKRGSR